MRDDDISNLDSRWGEVYLFLFSSFVFFIFLSADLLSLFILEFPPFNSISILKFSRFPPSLVCVFIQEPERAGRAR